MSSAIACSTRARIRDANTVVLFTQRQLAGADVEEPELDVKRITGPLHRCEHHAVRIQLAPTWEGNVRRGLRLRDRSVRVARNQIELALEGQVVEEALLPSASRPPRSPRLASAPQNRHCVMERSADVAVIAILISDWLEGAPRRRRVLRGQQYQPGDHR
jgi:hypothetical protein